MLWDDLQKKWVDDLLGYARDGAQVIATAPTGFGKTRCMTTLINQLSFDEPVIVYTHRKLLFEQTNRALETAGIKAGRRASGHHSSLWKNVQIAMVPTEAAKVLKNKQRELHDARVVLWDEGHVFKNGAARELAARHARAGAANIYLTATPVGMGDMATHLSVGATNSQCREIGAHVPCMTYGPSEVDMKNVDRMNGGEFHRGQLQHAYSTQHIAADVLKHYKILNPDQKPAVLFGPGVSESKWFCDKFTKAGIKAAHIDGQHCRIDGKDHATTQELRDEIAEMSRTGEVKIVTNRFVLREGIDWPWLYHAIMATAFGTEEGFLQAGGRLLRSHPSLTHVVLQCHGGSWWRYGSLNEDRTWDINDTNQSRAKATKAAREKGEEEEPQCCPACGGIRRAGRGRPCPHCGHEYQKSIRRVMEVDADLVRQEQGPAVKRKKPKAGWQKDWDQLFWSAKKSNTKNPSNFNQLRARFEKATNMKIIFDGNQAVVQTPTGETYRLRNAPPPGRSWAKTPKHIPYEKLQ